jgi:UDP:flavonoid glycosyltransferase YjiC (YdhE family)
MRVLFTTYEGGGHVPPALIVARRLATRGHEVLFVSDEATRPAALKARLDFTPWRNAPNRALGGQADDPLEDWKARTPLGVVRQVCDAVMCKPAAAYGRDTLDLIAEFRPDVIVTQELLFGVMAAAQGAGVKLALLTGNLWCFPTRQDLAPFGPGFAPARTPGDQQRDRITRWVISRLYDVGLKDLNAARAQMRLEPLARTLDQLDAADLILIGASEAFDVGSTPPPAPFHYAGPLISIPEWVAPSPAPATDDRPLVLVSFSTTFQDQIAVVRRCVAALEDLPVRGIVTLGPAMRVQDVAGAPNVEVMQSASHDAIVPLCSLVISHGGHGTMLRPLMHGVPVLCLPMGRDQPDNAARIAARGAGLTLSSRSGARAIRRAAQTILADPSYAAAAATLGARIRAEVDGGMAAAKRIEDLAGRV